MGAEANNPVMQEALTTGVANSLGKDPADVKITSIDGVAITRRRRLTDVKIEFEVVSNSDDADAADQLKTDLETAATEGSIVANVQANAQLAPRKITMKAAITMGKHHATPRHAASTIARPVSLAPASGIQK